MLVEEENLSKETERKVGRKMVVIIPEKKERKNV